MTFTQLVKSLPEDVRDRLFSRLDEIQLSSSVAPAETRARVQTIVDDLRLDFAFDGGRPDIMTTLSLIPDAVINELFEI